MRAIVLSVSLMLFSLTTQASTLVAGCGYSILPYVIPQTDRGIALDVLRQAMATQGYKLAFEYDSNSNLVQRFNDDKLDIACVSNAATTPDAYFSSQPLIVMHNMAISLDKTGAELSAIADLAHYRVIGFSLATRLMPQEYTDAVAKSPQYQEMAEQIHQVTALFKHDTDVIVMDQTIFRYYLSRLRHSNAEDSALTQTYRYHNLFEPTYYYAAFHSAAARDSFDEGLRILKDSGDYRKIMDGYEKMLADYLFR